MTRAIFPLLEAPVRKRDYRKVSHQKKEALFELAIRIAQLADKARLSPLDLERAAATEKRKSLKSALALVSAGSDAEGLARGMSRLLVEADSSLRLELEMVIAGVRGILAGEHYSIIMRRMTAFLGFEYYDKTTAWLETKIKRRKPRSENIIVPGEMPDVVQALAVDPKSLELCIRAAGRAITTAALAGCPQESVDHAKRLFGPIGSSALEDDAAYLRSRLSSDEISEAQAAFLEVVSSLEERGEIRIGVEEDIGTDELFVAAFTKAVMTVPPQTIRSVIKSAEGALIAAAMQGLEPKAHDHILKALPKKEATRILDAIDAADPLPKRAVLSAARELAARFIASSSRGVSSAVSIDNLTVVRDWAI